jgi:hypothetical protein
MKIIFLASARSGRITGLRNFLGHLLTDFLEVLANTCTPNTFFIPIEKVAQEGSKLFDI